MQDTFVPVIIKRQLKSGTMVEVFKTNVSNAGHADMLVGKIHELFADYKANFDLDDCDNILRVASRSGYIEPSSLISFLNYHGFQAEVLTDEIMQ